jgi:hypothetical protein
MHSGSRSNREPGGPPPPSLVFPRATSPALDGCTLSHISLAILILLVEAVVFTTLIYVAVKFGVRDGLTDFEKRKRDGTGDLNR